MQKFSVRDLFWLTLVVAMGMAWLLDNRRQADVVRDSQREAKAAKDELGIAKVDLESRKQRAKDLADEVKLLRKELRESNIRSFSESLHAKDLADEAKRLRKELRASK